MAEPGLPFIQINLHHSKGASAVLARCMSKVQTGISLIQEPWVNRGSIRGIGSSGALFKCPTEKAPRACVLVKGLDAALMPDFCSRDLATVMLRCTGRGGERREIVVGSAYFPHDAIEAPPPADVAGLVDFCRRHGHSLILGCDSNSHHTVWGSSDVNERGRALLEYLATTDLEILNRGNEPTFQTANRREVLDITLCSARLVDEVVAWRVSKEPSLSDHRHVLFRLESGRRETKWVRNPRRTSWPAFREELAGRLRCFPTKYGTEEEVELAVEVLRGALVTSYENNCPLRAIVARNGAPWWNTHLQGLRSKTRRLLNRANKTKAQSDWDLFKEAQRGYKRAICEARKKSWEGFCSGLEKVSDAAKLHRILARNPDARLGLVRLPSGDFASTEEESLNHLLEVHFPGFGAEQEREGDEDPVPTRRRARHWELASKIVSPTRVEWAIRSFQPFKSPGTDGIFPALLQEGTEIALPSLTKIMRSCIALSYIPRAWRTAKVVFIPKPGRPSHTQAKDFRPISLTSFLLKTLERLVDRFIRDGALRESPLHQSQHAYKAGSSVETALHSIVGRIEGQLERGGSAVATFLDIEGAFNNTSSESVCNSAINKGVPGPVVDWIRNMLTQREVVVEHSGTTVRGSVSRGCPQGGVLSPLLWCLVVDELLKQLNDEGLFSVGYADDIAILVRGNFIEVLLDLSQRALDIVQGWCTRTGLSVNPEKTEMVVFTKKYKMGPIVGPIFYGERLQISGSAKYLGVILDSKLTWKKHLEQQARKFYATFWLCRRAFSTSWGLRPNMVYWLYSAVLRPRLLYAALVWWPRTELKTARTGLSHLQGLALRGITGAMRTTPIAAMEALLGVPPLQLAAKGAAALAAYRLSCTGNWKYEGAKHTRLRSDILSDPIFRMGQDRIVTRYHFETRYKVSIPQRADWSEGADLLPRHGDIWYTDGSRAEGRTGAGIYGRSTGARHAVSLGKYATVFQTEICAILVCTQCILEGGGAGRDIRICSDSQAALAALKAPDTSSRLVWACKEALNLLAKNNRVTLVWVPGHSGIRGNEEADRLAREGSSRDLLGPEPAVGIPFCQGKMEIKKWISAQHRSHWTNIPGCRQAKLLLGEEVHKKWPTQILRLSRGGARAVTGLLTGHCHLQYHRYKLGLTTTTECRRCGEDEETSMHILCQCPALAGHRHRILGSNLLEPEDIRSLSVGNILDFARRTGILAD